MTKSTSSRESSFRGRVVAGGEGPVSAGNLANLITVLRIAVAPVVLWLMLFDAGEWGTWRIVAAALFLLAISTDGVDGALARRRNLITNAGIILDPVADKALTGAAFIGLALVAELPWWVVIVVLGREILITLFRLVMLPKRVIPASRGGKLKTVSQAVALGSWLTPTWLLLGEWVFVLNDYLMGIAVVLTVVTGVDYLIRGVRAPRSTDAASR
jgi:CDP-diacylglycerol--glycerol-3-phosphate 3-phosphatidyltransferase